MSDLGPPQIGDPWEVVSHAAEESLRSGDFGEALGAYRRAVDLAVQSGDQDRIDASELNVAMTLLQLGEARRAEEGLREILIRSRDAKIAFSAAYNLASSLRRQGRLERAMTYARRALARAEASENPDQLAPAHNLIGNIYLGQSYLDEALGEYFESLRIRETQTGEDTRFSRAILEENIGYCLLLRREIEAGVRHIELALQLAEEVGDDRCRTECLQDLCYAMLMSERLEEARSLGERALSMATVGRYADLVENCHYLLGEVGSRSGDLELRDLHFSALQQRHPELPFLHEFLSTVDVTGIITLKR